MAEEILVKADEVWDYFQQNKLRLANKMHCIAKNEEYGIEIFLTEDAGFPAIYIENDSITIYENTIYNESKCNEVMKEIYDDYLTDRVVSLLANSSNDNDVYIETEEELNEMEIAAREEEISEAVQYCLDVILGGKGIIDYFDEIDEICEDVKDLLCEYLYCKWGIEPYRPMYVEFEDGTESFEEYPYEFLELENEDNPLFKQ